MRGASDPVGLLAAALRADPGRPLLTWYGPADSRVELSVATVANWVAKTAGLLSDELGLAPGDVVAVRLPAHWLAPVWALATWTAGGTLALADEGAVTVVDPAGSDTVVGGELVVVGTGPFGGPAGVPLPPGACDYGREVLAQPDRFSGGAPTRLPDDLAARVELRAGGLPARARLLVAADWFDEAALEVCLLVPLLLGGSAVLVQGPHDLAAIAAAEQAVTTGRW